MATSKRRPKNNVVNQQNDALLNHLRRFVKDFLKQHRLANPSFLIAYSGGLDSTVLLHAFQQLKTEIPLHLSAMHVHHGLSKHADEWAGFCEKTCANLDVPMELHHVQVDSDSGLGTEAAARQARYQALNTTSADFICLAHHQDDQAETLLLQLARGAGVKGLAGMAPFDKTRRLLRPFLDVPREVLQQHAEQYALQWIEDDSNTDVTFDRNFMRHTLLPVLAKRYPSITKTLARSASHMADADCLLDDLAALDAVQVIEPSQQCGVIKLAALKVLSTARQANLVRYWLMLNTVMQPSAALLSQILSQLQSTKADAAIRIKVADGLYIMRYQGLGYLVKETENKMALDLPWLGEELVVLPDLSRLLFTLKKGEGLAYQREELGQLRIKTRQGGETLRPEQGRPKRRLKTLLQSSNIPPWQREQMPLIFVGERLVAIPNNSVEVEFQAESHEMGVTIRWESATQS